MRPLCILSALLRLMITIVAGITVASCTTYTGVTEFEGYRAAFDKNYEVASSVLDRFGVEERALYLSVRPPLKGVFDPGLASYYVDYVDPPTAAAFRRSLDMVKAYNDLLYSLSVGEPAANVAARLGRLDFFDARGKGDIEQLRSALPKELNVELAATVGRLITIIAPIEKVLAVTLKYENRAKFREFAIQHEAVIKEVLLNLRGASKQIYAVLVRKEADKFSGIDERKISLYRQLISDFVIGLDEVTASMDEMMAAIRMNSKLSANQAAALNARAARLDAIAANARRHISEIGN